MVEYVSIGSALDEFVGPTELLKPQAQTIIERQQSQAPPPPGCAFYL